MIRVIRGTTYITAEAFQDRYSHAVPGAPFIYATGDLAGACNYDADARSLRDLIWKMSEEKKIALSQRRRPDLLMKGCTVAFDYLATKCREGTR